MRFERGIVASPEVLFKQEGKTAPAFFDEGEEARHTRGPVDVSEFYA